MLQKWGRLLRASGNVVLRVDATFISGINISRNHLRLLGDWKSWFD